MSENVNFQRNCRNLGSARSDQAESFLEAKTYKGNRDENLFNHSMSSISAR